MIITIISTNTVRSSVVCTDCRSEFRWKIFLLFITTIIVIIILYIDFFRIGSAILCSLRRGVPTRRMRHRVFRVQYRLGVAAWRIGSKCSLVRINVPNKQWWNLIIYFDNNDVTRRPDSGRTTPTKKVFR